MIRDERVMELRLMRKAFVQHVRRLKKENQLIGKHDLKNWRKYVINIEE